MSVLGRLEIMTPTETLNRLAKLRPSHTAFISNDQIWTYRRLADEAERVACAFAARGVRRGDRVVLHMANLPELAASYFACLLTGAIACPLNIRLKTAELRPLLQRLQPSLYVGQAETYANVAGIEPTWTSIVGGVPDDEGEWVASAREISAAHTIEVDEPAVLLHTSGTTGQPKFVTHTLTTLTAVTDTWKHLGLPDAGVVLHCLPMVHASGLYTFLACIRFGIPMVLLERFDSDAVLDAIEAHRCDWLLGLPFMFAALLQRQRENPRKIDALKMCVTAGDVCPAELQQEFPHVFGVPLRSFWASTEAVGLTFAPRFGPVSRVTPGTRVRLVDDQGAPVPRGEAGELLLRSASLSVGYWEGPDRVEPATVDGWFHTGDIMRQSEEDELWFVSRKKDLIIRGGSNISPVEIEKVLRSHPEVRDAAVFGVPDATLGERVAAIVQLSGNGGATALDRILASASHQLADYKVPETMKAVSTIPRNALGKIDRASLPALL
jgi:long-chain acyl-CoA synthetase/feruloyl-CoA synthase